MAAALRADPARPADDRHEQDREAHARAPEVPPRPRRRRRVLRARARRDGVPPVHRRPTKPRCTSRSCATAASGSGTCRRGPLVHRRRGRVRARDPRVARRERRGAAAVRDHRRRGRVRPRVAGASSRPTAGSASTGRRSTAAAARRRSQVAIFNMEYARSRALQPINRVGINLAGPDAARARHRRAEGSAGCRRSSPPTRSGASCSASPTPAPTSRR